MFNSALTRFKTIHLRTDDRLISVIGSLISCYGCVQNCNYIEH